LRSRTRSKTIGVTCSMGLERSFEVGGRPTTVVVPVPPHSSRSCIVFITRGGIDLVGRRQVSVEAQVALEP
jgi:hypothetical protein